jgi:hypothetical protein
MEHYFMKDAEDERDDYGLEGGDGIGIARRRLIMDVSIAARDRWRRRLLGHLDPL